MRRATLWGWALALGAVGALALTGTATAQEKKVLIGMQCDRTGPTQIVGIRICPAYQDYFKLINSQGRGRGLQDRRPRNRQRIQGAAGG